MIWRKNSLLIIILFAFISNCHKQDKKNIIDLKYVSGVLIVNGKVGGSIHGMFQIDTGASSSMIRKKVADKLNIVPSEQRQGHGPEGKTFIAPMAEVASISIGDYGTSLPSCVIVNMQNQNVPEKFLGLIGSDFIKNFIITIDYKKKELIFEDKQSLNNRLLTGIKIPIKFNKNAPNIPYVRVTINDSVNGEYIFDTGVPITHLSYNDFQAIGLTKDIQKMQKKSKNILGSKFETLYTNISSFSINDSLKIMNFKICTCDNCDGLIGNNFLSNFIVTLNYKEKYILFNKI